jgi:hypothetical protein
MVVFVLLLENYSTRSTTGTLLRERIDSEVIQQYLDGIKKAIQPVIIEQKAHRDTRFYMVNFYSVRSIARLFT